MRTPKPKGITIGEVHRPTIVGSLSHGKHTVAERHIPDGTPWAFDIDRAENALAALTGATLRDRQIVDLADGLRSAADGEGNPAKVLTGAMRRAPTVEQVCDADAYVAALRRPSRRSRGQNSRAACFYRLVLGLRIPAESGEQDPARALAKLLQKARKKLR